MSIPGVPSGGVSGPFISSAHPLISWCFRRSARMRRQISEVIQSAGKSFERNTEMGIFSDIFGGGGEHHETPCDTKGSWWAKPNPMGYGNDNARVIKQAGKDARSQNNRTTDHGSKAGKALLSGRGALIRWDGDHVQVSGEKPGKRG